MSRRVVVTGLGAVTPIGNNVDDFWASVKAGKIGFDHITKFDTTDYKCHIAAELKDFNPHAMTAKLNLLKHMSMKNNNNFVHFHPYY